MATRSASTPKPTSYTFNSGDSLFGDADAFWLFNADDITGSSVVDTTGNDHTLTMNGTSGVVSTDATHGQCFQGDGTDGATMVPYAGLSSYTDYSVFVVLRIDDDINGSGGTENIVAIENTSGAQDTMFMNWLTSENVNCGFEDSDSSSTATITDGFLNNSTEWGGIMAVCDATQDEVVLYCTVDGETTAVDTNTTAGIGGTSGSDNLIEIARSWHGLVECVAIFPSVKTASDFESMFANPYSAHTAGGGGGSSVLRNKLNLLNVGA